MVMVVSVPAVKANLLLGDEILRKSAHGVQVGLVRGGKQIAQRTRHVAGELRLAYRCKPAERAKRLH